MENLLSSQIKDSLFSWTHFCSFYLWNWCALLLTEPFVLSSPPIRVWWSSCRTFPQCTGATRKWAYCWPKPTGWSLPSLTRPTTTRDDKRGSLQLLPFSSYFSFPVLQSSTELRGLYSYMEGPSLFLTSSSHIAQWAFHWLRDLNQPMAEDVRCSILTCWCGTFFKKWFFSNQLWNVHSFSPMQNPRHHWRPQLFWLEFGPLKLTSQSITSGLMQDH